MSLLSILKFACCECTVFPHKNLKKDFLSRSVFLYDTAKQKLLEIDYCEVIVNSFLLDLFKCIFYYKLYVILEPCKSKNSVLKNI